MIISCTLLLWALQLAWLHPWFTYIKIRKRSESLLQAAVGWDHRLADFRMEEGHLHFTALHQLDQVSEQHVPVPLTETFCIIRHLERHVTDQLNRSVFWTGLVFELQLSQKMLRSMSAQLRFMYLHKCLIQVGKKRVFKPHKLLNKYSRTVIYHFKICIPQMHSYSFTNNLQTKSSPL